jgi:hypothetical protein
MIPRLLALLVDVTVPMIFLLRGREGIVTVVTVEPTFARGGFGNVEE